MKKLGRILFFTVSGLLVLAAAALIVGYVWINRYLAGDEFRALVSQGLSRKLGVEGKFEPFRWSGFAIYSAGFSAQGQSGSPVERLQVDELHASVNLAAALRGSWQLDQLEVGRVHLTLRDAAAAGAAAAPETSAASPAPGNAPAVHVGTVRLDEVNLTWPESMASGGNVAGMSVELKDNGQGWTVEGRHGTFAFAKLPIQQIEKISMRISPDRLYLTKAELRNPAGGTVQVGGELGLGASPDFDLRIDIAGVAITPFLPEDWRAKLFGDLFSSFRLTRDTAPDAPWKVDGQGRLENARLEALPVLNQIASLTKTDDYRTLKLQSVRSDFTAGPGRVELKNLVVEAEGLVRVEGGITDTADALDGLLQIGLPPGKLAILPGAGAVFADQRGVYAFTPVKVGGTVQSPSEDLTPRLMAAAAAAIQQGISNTINGAADLFRSFLNK